MNEKINNRELFLIRCHLFIYIPVAVSFSLLFCISLLVNLAEFTGLIDEVAKYQMHPVRLFLKEYGVFSLLGLCGIIWIPSAFKETIRWPDGLFKESLDRFEKDWRKKKFVSWKNSFSDPLEDEIQTLKEELIELRTKEEGS